MRAMIFVAVLAAGCLPHSDYHCTTNDQCGSSGTCESVGYCSFPDTSCTGGARFGTGAGSYENQCVGEVAIDGGIDTPPPIDAPPGGCPAGYLTITGGTTAHKYKLITGIADWSTQMASCAATSASAYLAIPDDAGELTALSTLAAVAQYWVGISDTATEGTFVTVKGAPAPTTLWAPGQPDNSGPGGSDCVAGLMATSTLDDLRCNTKLRAICECEE